MITFGRVATVLKGNSIIDIFMDGIKIGEIDENGNLKIKGTFMEGQDL